jgi:hypothetical protein
MKTIRSLTTNLGLSLALFALAAIGAKAETLDSIQFVGTFTLPFAAQWGKTTLPAGDYDLRYGTLNNGVGFAEVHGAAKGSPHIVIPAKPANQKAAGKNAIVCIRYGGVVIVRSLEMSAIGETVNFMLPPGPKLTAHRRNGRAGTQIAEAPMLIQRIPVTLNGK